MKYRNAAGGKHNNVKGAVRRSSGRTAKIQSSTSQIQIRSLRKKRMRMRALAFQENRKTMFVFGRQRRGNH